jgi:hypothetical protein
MSRNSPLRNCGAGCALLVGYRYLSSIILRVTVFSPAASRQ